MASEAAKRAHTITGLNFDAGLQGHGPLTQFTDLLINISPLENARDEKKRCQVRVRARDAA